MKYLAVFMLMFVLACGSEIDTPDMLESYPVDSSPVALDAVEQLSEVWICHHPGTKMHGQICVDAEFPRGCFVPGDSRKFCWALTSQDCHNQSREWQYENCHLLGM